MDIHKPKPWHGVREFLKEYVIIVVGVLTALAAEQGVEWLHWRHVTEQVEANLRGGVSTNVGNAMTRVASTPCTSARVLELYKALASDDPMWRGTTVPYFAQGVKPNLPLVIREPKGNYSRTPWEIAVAQGATTHLPPDKANLYARVYRSSAHIEDGQATEADLESRLALLAFDRPLSREQRDAFMTVLAQLDTTESHIAFYARQVLRDGQTLKVRPPPSAYPEFARQKALRGACMRDVPYSVN